MGGTLAAAASKNKNLKISLFDVDMGKAENLANKIGAEAASLEKVCKADYVFFGVKPQILPEVLNTTKDMLGELSVLVSMAAGFSISKIEEFVGTGRKIIRIMPNTPAAYGEGMMLVATNNAKDKIQEFKKIMAYSGKIEEIPERLIDAGTAVSGSGPAFVYMFIEALAKGGEKCGLPYDAALKLAAQTALGSAKTVLESGISPNALRQAVCSPGGTTIEGVASLEKGKLTETTVDAVKATYEKALKMGKNNG